jgi:hypothetical protein
VDQDKASVIERLEAYNRRFEELLALLAGDLPLRGAAKDRAQVLLKALKEDLGAEYREMSTIRGQATLTDIERSCYAPVVHQAFADIHVATNSTPNEKWHSELYGAQISITHMLHQLRGDSE